MPNDRTGAYRTQQRQNLTPREAEAMAFTKAAVLLEDARKNPGDYEAFAQALRFNHLLWTIIQADITDRANKLPPMIKANVLSLSIFVDKQTALALAEADPQILEALININRNMAEGLRMTPPADGVEKPAEVSAPAAPLGGGGVHA
ncbi:MAG: flagellar protein FlaF [Alphaproteobacteria bacterium RIFOXYD12_FULL_60_8]|nr:MAG: flagellar protein FlaF [Alphaproteobacteria bacterium RIFOXYD12_FULL_60_8]